MPEQKRTIKERIEELYQRYIVKGHSHEGTTENTEKQYFITDIFELIERASNPEGFCTECDSRMVYPQKCINCGHITNRAANPNASRRPTALPAGVENLIASVEDGKGKSKSKSPADKIKALRNKLDGTDGNVVDEEIVRSQDPKIKGEINWC